MRIWGLAAGVVVLLAARTAVTQDAPPRRWEVEARAGWIILGGQRTTGGLMPTAAARHRWMLGRAAEVSVGAELGAFGLGDGERWIGILGGPTVAGAVRPWAGPVALGLTFSGSFGRIPVCNDWGLCLRFVGVYPAVDASVTYYWERTLGVGAVGGARYVNTLAWEGAAAQIGARGLLFW